MPGTVPTETVEFANEEWIVTSDGLNHRTLDYFIPRELVGERRTDGLWSWPLQLAEKTWCSGPAFAEAFLAAVTAFGYMPCRALVASLEAFGLAGEQSRDQAVRLSDVLATCLRAARAAAREARPGRRRASPQRRPALTSGRVEARHAVAG